MTGWLPPQWEQLTDAAAASPGLSQWNEVGLPAWTGPRQEVSIRYRPLQPYFQPGPRQPQLPDRAPSPAPQFRQPATRRGVLSARPRPPFPVKAIRIPALPKSRRRGPSARHVIYLGTHPVAMMLSMMVYGMIIASYMSVVLLVLMVYAAYDLAVVAGSAMAAQPLALPD